MVGRDQNDLFDGFDPENRNHLHGLGVRCSRCGLAQQEGDVVGSAAEESLRRRRGRGNDDGDCVGDLLFADVIAQQFVGIVQQGLRDGAGGDKAAEILRDSRCVRVGGGLAGERDLLGQGYPVTNGVMSTGAMFGGPAMVTKVP